MPTCEHHRHLGARLLSSEETSCSEGVPWEPYRQDLNGSRHCFERKEGIGFGRPTLQPIGNTNLGWLFVCHRSCFHNNPMSLLIQPRVWEKTFLGEVSHLTVVRWLNRQTVTMTKDCPKTEWLPCNSVNSKTLEKGNDRLGKLNLRDSTETEKKE